MMYDVYAYLHKQAHVDVQYVLVCAQACTQFICTTYLRLSVYLEEYMDVFMYVCMHACMHACMHVSVPMPLCMYMYMYVCIFMYTQTIKTCVYIHTYIYREIERDEGTHISKPCTRRRT